MSEHRKSKFFVHIDIYTDQTLKRPTVGDFYMYICIRVCIYIYIFIPEILHERVSVRLAFGGCIHTCIHTYTYIRTSTGKEQLLCLSRSPSNLCYT